MYSKIIKPKKILGLHDLTELWHYRELFYYFVWRDFKVRYKQTVVGIVWVIFQPLVSMVIFSVIFGKLAKMPSDGVPYPLFVFSGLMFWQFFSTALIDTSESMIKHQSIITKVYFPRLILPLSAVAVKTVDFFVNFVVFLGIMIYYGYMPNFNILWSPILVLVACAVAVGPGLFLASLNVKYRDVRYILPFFVQLLLYVTPVIYPSSIATKYAWVLKLNPMAGVIESARVAFLGIGQINYNLLGYSVVFCLLSMVFGVYYFNKTERFFADVI